MRDEYAAIQAHRGRYPVRLMCEALGVSVGGFYAAEARRTAPPSLRASDDEQLRVKVRAAHMKSCRRYGALRVHRELAAAGERVSRKRVARLMREVGLVAHRRRKFVRRTDSDHTEPVAPNLLARRFAVAEHPEPDRVWWGDITFKPTREGWLFLAVLLDLATRRVVGWAMRETLATELPLAALRMALADRRPAPGLLQHTDRGSQCASGAYRAVLATHGVVQSTSRRGDCLDNAVAEAFFATLEHELLADADFDSRDAARQAILELTEMWYKGERRHSSLGYVSPVQYERQLTRAVRAA